MKRIILLSLLYFSPNVFGQLFESIEKEAANVFLMNENNSNSIIGLEKLRTTLSADIEKSDLEKTYNAKPSVIDTLRRHFDLFENESKNISSDSALFLFNLWYLHLSNIFYDYKKEKFLSSNKTKFLLFSTSMSCHCTLEMCKNQTIDILNFIKENNNEYDYWIIDSYEHNDLQLKYETFFAPSVIVFDDLNKVLLKIEYEQNMKEQLVSFLNHKPNTEEVNNE